MHRDNGVRKGLLLLKEPDVRSSMLGGVISADYLLREAIESGIAIFGQGKMKWQKGQRVMNIGRVLLGPSASIESPFSFRLAKKNVVFALTCTGKCINAKRCSFHVTD